MCIGVFCQKKDIDHVQSLIDQDMICQNKYICEDMLFSEFEVRPGINYVARIRSLFFSHYVDGDNFSGLIPIWNKRFTKTFNEAMKRDVNAYRQAEHRKFLEKFMH